MRRYRCHKQVRAFRIAQIKKVELPKFGTQVCRGFGPQVCRGFGPHSHNCGHCERCTWLQEYGHLLGCADLVSAESDVQLSMGRSWMEKHQPVVGGYLILHADGSRSFLSAQAFHEEYSLVDKEDFA